MISIPEFGKAFETFLMHEIISYRDYVSGEALIYWRSTTGTVKAYMGTSYKSDCRFPKAPCL
jgi:hypothetical protein